MWMIYNNGKLTIKLVYKWYVNFIYHLIWVNFITTSLVSLTGNHGFYRGIIPKWAARFRLVEYYNLPRLMWMIYHYSG